MAKSEERARRVLAMARAAGFLLVAAGVVSLATLTTLEYVGWLYGVFGLALVGMGLAWVNAVNKAEKRRRAREGLRRKAAYALLPLLLAASLHAAVMAFEKGFSSECVTAYRRTLYVEYTMLGLLLVAGFLSFGSLLFSRTPPLSLILQPLSDLAAGMLILLIIGLLLFYPLDVIFEFNNDGTMCRVNLELARTMGPPLLRVFINLIYPPSPPTT